MLRLNERKWKKLLLWVSAYVNLLAFVVVGGYFMLKEEDEEVKYSAKWVFLASLLFIAIGAFLNFCSYIGGALDWYGSWVYKIYSGLALLNNVGRIVVFTACALIAVFKKDGACACAKEETAEQTDKTDETEQAGQEKKEEKQPEQTVAHASARDEKMREFFNIVYDVLHETRKEEEISAYLQTEESMRADLKKACALAEERATVSVSMLQKNMKIGYTYAGSIVEGLVLTGVAETPKEAKSNKLNKERLEYLKKFL